ncbi:MAG TPA: sodium:solute symporter, partial [Planctomycetota bacterium]|nr:sodium:solute symporter [Planctomycetota bacterium]
LGIGVLLFAFYRPDVTASAPPLDKAFPTFIARELPPGIAGFVVAAIFAAAFSSSLNSIAASAVHDLLRPVVKTIDDARALTLARWLTVAAGVAQIAVALAFLGSSGSAVDHALGAASLLYGPILGVFLLGLCVPRAASGAAIAGLVAGAAAAGFVWLGTDVAWPWYTAVGSAVTLAVGAAVARLR